MNVELPYFLEAARQGRATIHWALLSECLYERTPFEDIQALHDVERLIDSLRARHERES